MLRAPVRRRSSLSLRTAIDADARLACQVGEFVRARYLRMSRAHQLRRLHMHAKKLKMLKRHLRTTYDMSGRTTERSGACPPTIRW